MEGLLTTNINILSSTAPVVEMHASAITAFGLVRTLTFDLWHWKSRQQCPLTRWIFVVGFIQIPALRRPKEISRQAIPVLTDGRPSGRPEYILPPLRILRWRRHKNIQIWRLTQADVYSHTLQYINAVIYLEIVLPADRALQHTDDDRLKLRTGPSRRRAEPYVMTGERHWCSVSRDARWRHRRSALGVP